MHYFIDSEEKQSIPWKPIAAPDRRTGEAVQPYPWRASAYRIGALWRRFFCAQRQPCSIEYVGLNCKALATPRKMHAS
jgi:hypothetical protein